MRTDARYLVRTVLMLGAVMLVGANLSTVRVNLIITTVSVPLGLLATVVAGAGAVAALRLRVALASAWQPRPASIVPKPVEVDLAEERRRYGYSGSPLDDTWLPPSSSTSRNGRSINSP